MTIERWVYRVLQRQAKRIDRHAIAKSLVVAPPKRIYNNATKQVIQRKPGGEPMFEAIVSKFNQGGEFHIPNDTGRSMQRLIRDVFEHRAIDKYVFTDEEVESGAFALLRHFSKILEVKNRIYSEKLHINLHPTSEFELLTSRPDDSGTFLVTHPVSYINDEIFDRSVIFLINGVRFSDGTDDPAMLGLIVNQPIGVEIGALGPPNAEFTDVMKPFQKQPIFRGGPMMLENSALSIIHTAGDTVPESVRIGSHDMWLSANWKGAAEAVDSGKCQPDQFKFYLGFCLWTAEQLETELERHMWFHMDPQSKTKKHHRTRRPT